MKKHESSEQSESPAQSVSNTSSRGLAVSPYLWAVPVVALLIGVTVSSLVVANISQPNSLEARTNMLRMCRRNPNFDRKGCAQLLKAVALVKEKGDLGGGKKGGKHGSSSGQGNGNYKGDGTKLSHLSRNQAFSMNEEEEDS
jgi:hypothetical protein